jgi:tetratricopeptide (TPR) repeat protein
MYCPSAIALAIGNTPLMKAKLLAITAFLTAFCLAPPARAGNLEHTRQLLATKQCERCDLSGEGLVLADLSGANLRGANLSGANLSRANLSGADLSGANLSGASLYGANLGGAKLEQTDLSGADLRDAYLADVDLKTAKLNSTSLQGAISIPTQAAQPEEFYRWGIAQGQKGDPKGAIGYFNQALSLNDKYAPAYMARGIARYQLLDRMGAMQDAQRAKWLFLRQRNNEGYVTAQAFLQQLQAPQTDMPKSKPNFFNFLGGVTSILLRFLL